MSRGPNHRLGTNSDVDVAYLWAELKEYEELHSGRGGFPRISSMSELSRVIIRARIVSGLSQNELAERLGLKEQQIQRYEATDYASASLSRLIEVSRAVEHDLFAH